MTQIDERIAELEQQLENPPQQRAEVHSRIVGYYRVIDNWNPGKREEYRHRAAFNVGEVSHNVPRKREVYANHDNMEPQLPKRTTFRPEQAGALPIIADFQPLRLGKDDWSPGERQEEATEYEACESCQ